MRFLVWLVFFVPLFCGAVWASARAEQARVPRGAALHFFAPGDTLDGPELALDLRTGCVVAWGQRNTVWDKVEMPRCFSRVTITGWEEE